jgi:hypothetical protein
MMYIPACTYAHDYGVILRMIQFVGVNIHEIRSFSKKIIFPPAIPALCRGVKLGESNNDDGQDITSRI